jgi:hypothetical protein
MRTAYSARLALLAICLLPLASCLLPLASCLLPLFSRLLPLVSCLTLLTYSLVSLASLAPCPLASCSGLPLPTTTTLAQTKGYLGIRTYARTYV